MKNWWRKQWRRWLGKRLSWQTATTLNQRNIYIFATSFGLFYLLITTLLFIVALNYQNNSVYAFCFFLVAVFVATILPTFNNIYNLEVRSKGHLVGLVGETIEFPIEINAKHRDRYALGIGIESVRAQQNIAAAESQTVYLSYKWIHSGVQKLPPIRLQSIYPLGLFRAWSWLGMAEYCYIAPYPHRFSELHELCGQGIEKGRQQTNLDDEIQLREYREGDSAKDIYWRRVAADGTLLSKTNAMLSTGQKTQYLLNYQCSRGQLHHDKLADLCYWLLECGANDYPVGLSLPAVDIEVGCGEKHIKQCLIELARSL